MTSTRSCGRQPDGEPPRLSVHAAGVEALARSRAATRGQAKAHRRRRSAVSTADDGEDFLIEPGAGGPQRAREARELAQMIGPKTNPAVSVHIAAARRAAQAALAESSAASKRRRREDACRFRTGAVRRARRPNARAFYASHKRTVLLGVAVAIAATLAVRMVGVRAPFLQRSELGGQAVNTAKLDAPKGKPAEVAGAVKPAGEAIDVAPTASIAQPPAKPDALGSCAARAGLRRASSWRRFRPGSPRPCATRSRPASPTRNTNSRCACSKAGGCRRISRRPPAGSNAPPRSASRRRNIGSARCTRRALASPATRRPQSAGISRRPRPATRGPRTISRS